MPNRLAHETSPYLLQHQNNPVDWYPWGPEALARAQRENKPIFLSVGYSACHWCHVMEHESFEDEALARYLNEHFISIKVDREERPDLDQIYMNAVQILTGRGGWPMSVFLTPEGKPFYGGTYWPPRSRMGMPGFDQVLRAVVDAWEHRRAQVLQQAEELTGYLQTIEEQTDDGGSSAGPTTTAAATSQASAVEVPEAAPGGKPAPLTLQEGQQILQHASGLLRRMFDARHGGFGSAPKFPHPMELQLLLRLAQRGMEGDLVGMVTLTLEKMAAGGIYDHLAGGFARYSVDAQWLVPHFEKMLYDNALLVRTYVEAYQVTGLAHLAEVASQTCDYVLSTMTDPQGGFYSSEDADSEGQEGKFYLWTAAEIRQVLSPEAAERFCYAYDVSEEGNFEHGQNILHLPKTLAQCAALKGWDLATLTRELAESRAKLLAHRATRVRPGRDDKVLVSWNSLMIDALAYAAPVLRRPELLLAAEKAARFLLTHLRRPDGRLWHCWRAGQARHEAFLDDYAYLVQALVTLYERTFDERWLVEAIALADLMRQHFEDRQRGGFFFTADDHEKLIARNKDLHDASVPSGNAMAATALLRLGRLAGRWEDLLAAGRTLALARRIMEQTPTGAGQMLLALDRWVGPAHELVLVGGTDEAANQEALAALQTAFLPRSVLAYRGAAGPSQPADFSEQTPALTASSPAALGSPLEGLFEGRTAENGHPTLYICQDQVCQPPVVGTAAIRAALAELAAIRSPTVTSAG
jgi:uncharacterized protein YyaL (SSP411 family)